jgi:hypothetical protein
MQAGALELTSVIQAKEQMGVDLDAALECAEAATMATNDLVGRTLETAVSGKEAATTLHHAYSAQVLVARVLEWSKEWASLPEVEPSVSPLSKLDDCLSWMRRAYDHAEKLCRCFPPSDIGNNTPRVAEWADRWAEDYWQAKSLAEKSLQRIKAAIETMEQRHHIEKLNRGD